jgi:hypothetical protein
MLESYTADAASGNVAPWPRVGIGGPGNPVRGCHLRPDLS